MLKPKGGNNTMLYYDKLEEVIFNIDDTFNKEPDKLIH